MDDAMIGPELLRYAQSFLNRTPAPAPDEIEPALRALLHAANANLDPLAFGQTVEWEPPAALAELDRLCVQGRPGEMYIIAASASAPADLTVVLDVRTSTPRVVAVTVNDKRPLVDDEQLDPTSYRYWRDEADEDRLGWLFRRAGRTYRLWMRRSPKAHDSRTGRSPKAHDSWTGDLTGRYGADETLEGSRESLIATPIVDEHRGAHVVFIGDGRVLLLEPAEVTLHRSTEPGSPGEVFAHLVAQLPVSAALADADGKQREPNSRLP